MKRLILVFVANGKFISIELPIGKAALTVLVARTEKTNSEAGFIY